MMLANDRRGRHILHIVPWWGPGIGGVKRFVLNAAEALDGEPYRVSVLSIGKVTGCSFGLEVEGVLTKNHSFSNFLQAARPLEAKLRSVAPDVVHVHCSNGVGLFYAFVACRSGRAMRIVHSHSSSLGSEELWKRSADSVLKRAFATVPSERVACSKLAGDWLFGERPYRIVHNGIDVERFAFSASSRFAVRAELGIPQKSKTIGLVGAGVPVKNASFAVDALMKMRLRGEDAHLILVGEGVESDALHAKADESRLSPNTHFTGTVGDVWRYYSAMDVLAMPSYYEGLPLTLIEAQANGLPCVVSDTVSMEADVTGEVRYVSLQNAAAWQDALISCAVEGVRRIRSEPSKAVDRVRSAGFSFEGLRSQLLSLYEEG